MDYCIRIFFLFGLFCIPCYGQDTSNPNDWVTIKLSSTYNDNAPKKIDFDDQEGLAYSLDATPLQSQWLRVTTSSVATAPDIKIATTVIDSSKARYSKFSPTQCIVISDIKTCVNNIWIAKSTDTIGLRFSWLKSKNFQLKTIKYETARHSILDTANEDRYKKLITTMSQIYYRSNDVDWKNLYSMGQQALTAPPSIDPLPGAIAEVINRLPGNQETFIFNKVIPYKNSHSSNPMDENTFLSNYLPSCEPINGSTWRLNLPGTLAPSGSNWFEINSKEYVETSHKCLSQAGVTKWVVNLTNANAGDYISLLAALAPLLGNGPVLTQKNTSNDIKIFIDNSTINEGSKTLIAWQNSFPAYNGQIDFILGDACGNKICSQIWLAIKEHGRTIGFQNDAIFGRNIHITINQTIELQITQQQLADAEGNLYTKVNPDVVIDATNLKKALNDQLQQSK